MALPTLFFFYSWSLPVTSSSKAVSQSERRAGTTVLKTLLEVTGSAFWKCQEVVIPSLIVTRFLATLVRFFLTSYEQVNLPIYFDDTAVTTTHTNSEVVKKDEHHAHSCHSTLVQSSLIIYANSGRRVRRNLHGKVYN